jgi:hypothetical protein
MPDESKSVCFHLQRMIVESIEGMLLAGKVCRYRAKERGSQLSAVGSRSACTPQKLYRIRSHRIS